MVIRALSSPPLLSATSLFRHTAASARSISSSGDKLNFFHESARTTGTAYRSIVPSTTTKTVDAYPSITTSSLRTFTGFTNLVCDRDLSRKVSLLAPSFKAMSTAASASSSTDADISFPVAASIRQKLTEEFEPTHLEVINESHMHNVPKNSETHFKVVVVSSKFDSLTMIKRHRSINTALKDELQDNGGTVHALSIVAKTPAQWSSNSEISPSPKCAGGSKR